MIFKKYLDRIIFRNRNNKWKKRFNKCGNNLSIFGTPHLVSPKDICLGDNVHINDGAVLNATRSKIIIGDNVTISANAMVLGATYDPEAFVREGIRKHVYNEVVIGSNIWICGGGNNMPWMPFDWKECNCSSWRSCDKEL